MKYTLLLSLFLTACGGGVDTTHTKMVDCVGSIVAVMAAMTSPQFVGYGTPDSTTTYPVVNGEHRISYLFASQHTTLTFAWTPAGSCTEIIETF